MARRLTQAEILERFKETHGERYDYRRAFYRGMARRVTIGCPEHGEFEQTPQAHARGYGCPVCTTEKTHPQRLRWAGNNDAAELATDYKTEGKKR